MNQFKMGIHGMTCTGCEEHIEKALESIGATKIKVNFRRNEAVFQLPDDCAIETAIKAVKETNYEPGEIENLSAREHVVSVNKEEYDLLIIGSGGSALQYA